VRILISGASGLVGSELVPALERAGHRVTRLARRVARGENESVWDPMGGKLDAAVVEQSDVVINLAGESIASGRWTSARKQRIRDSRVRGTQTMATALGAAPSRPRTLINASAIGYYGNRGDEVLDETSPPGHGDFLSDVCVDWEAATAPAAAAGVRVVLTRFGVILSGKGGALKKMLLPFRLGLGGKIGSGLQYMSWVAIDDVIGAILHCLNTEAVRGPVNVVAPQSLTNLEFTKSLGRALSRPTIFPMPAPVARLALGQMADELLLSGQRVKPAKLLDTQYAFKYPELAGALAHVLNT
jgi:uncharacterized protein